MIERRLLYYQLRTLLVIALIWMLFGVIFFYNIIDAKNDLGVRVSLLRFSIIFGIFGFIISYFLVVLKHAFIHYPLWLSILIKMLITFLLFLVLSFIILTIYFVFLYNGNFESFTRSFFTKIVMTKTFRIFFLDLGVMTLLSIILLEVTDKYGPGMFWSMLTGEYHKPQIEDRIFIFLDINASTTIAEQLGHKKYFRMLKDFFGDITIPVIANDGTIYQYVGDEVVLSWRNTPENKVKALKFIRNTFFLLKKKGTSLSQKI